MDVGKDMRLVVRRLKSCVVLLAVAALWIAPALQAQGIPARLTDEAFWKMVTEF